MCIRDSLPEAPEPPWADWANRTARTQSDAPALSLIHISFKGLADTMRSIMHDRVLLDFMVAFFFYIDGVHTVI